MRTIASLLLLFLLAMVMPSTASLGSELRIAAWNLEHLGDTDGQGCVPREGADYDTIAQQVGALRADVVAFQEVENETAARRVFPSAGWNVAMSSRPAMNPGSACWDRPAARLGHLATGLAIRHGIAWRRNEDLTALGADDHFQRWGTDITVTVDGRDLRLLSVHLKTGWRGTGWGRRACGDLRSPSRSDVASRILGRRTPCRRHCVRHPGRFQPPSGGSRRLGMAAAVTAVGAAVSGDLGPRDPLRPPVQRAHFK